jgi:Protein of unknown function (DUF4199)
MAKLVLIFGLISGAIVSILMWLVMKLVMSGAISIDNALFLGYATMVIALSSVFFGIKSYRENKGGHITFPKAVRVGILISLICGVLYAASWEIYYPAIGPEFLRKYVVHHLEKMRKSGATDAEIEKVRVEDEEFTAQYNDHFFLRFGMTLMEILPVAVIVVVVSAGLLRKRKNLPAEPA